MESDNMKSSSNSESVESEELGENYINEIPVILDTIRTVNRGCYQSIIVYDLIRDEVLYFSDIWYNAFSALPQAYKVPFQQFKREATGIDWDRCVAFGSLAQQFYATLPSVEIMDYVAMFSCESCCGNLSVNLLHKSIPLRLTRTGKLWLSLILSFPATGNCGKEFEFENVRTHERFIYKGDKAGWVKQLPVVLTERERIVLIMAAQGRSLDWIANALCVSVCSVKACRNKLFAKLGVTNIQEAITKVMNHGYMWNG